MNHTSTTGVSSGCISYIRWIALQNISIQFSLESGAEKSQMQWTTLIYCRNICKFKRTRLKPKRRSKFVAENKQNCPALSTVCFHQLILYTTKKTFLLKLWTGANKSSSVFGNPRLVSRFQTVVELIICCKCYVVSDILCLVPCLLWYLKKVDSNRF